VCIAANVEITVIYLGPVLLFTLKNEGIQINYLKTVESSMKKLVYLNSDFGMWIAELIRNKPMSYWTLGCEKITGVGLIFLFHMIHDDHNYGGRSFQVQGRIRR
jgi:hypothetical protein